MLSIGSVIVLVCGLVVTSSAEDVYNGTEPGPSDVPGTQCDSQTCIRKCCPAGRMFHRGCSESNVTAQEWNDYFDIQDDNVSLLYGFPPQEDAARVCVLHDFADIDILKNGNVFFHKRQEVLDTSNYCIEVTIVESGEIGPMSGLCYEPIQRSQFQHVTGHMQLIGHCVSCAFLTTLIIMHVCWSSLRDTLHGKCFLSMCLALAFGFGCLIVILSPLVHYFNPATCLTMAIGVQYFLLSFWFWLMMRCYETLRIIRGTVKAIPLSLLNGGQRRFLRYSLICWGIPLLISLFTLAMQVVPGVPGNLYPGIGHGRCWFKEELLQLAVYYYAYQIILHVLNIAFMMCCAYLLWTTGEAFQCCCAVRKDVGLVAHNKKSLSMFWQQFYIFVLFIVLFGMDSVSLIESKSGFWRFLDIVNSFQGVFLFVIFMLSSKKRNVFLYVWEHTTSLANTVSSRLTPRWSWSPSSSGSRDSGQTEEIPI